MRLVRRRAHPSRRGQVLVIVGVGMVGLVAMAGLVIDLGFAFAKNRDVQNGADATAHAGAIVIVRNIATPGSASDADVDAAVDSAAAANGITLDHAEYTDWLGNPLASPVTVGASASGDIPPGAQGVRAVGSRIHDTILARVVGIGTMAVTGEATAVGGPAMEPCPESEECAFIPITFPTTIVSCDGQNKAVPTNDPWLENTEYIIPLCGNNAGSVGWLDWYAPNGGTSELAAEICDPNPPEMDLPDWFQVTSTGNVNALTVENCLNKYAGQRILMPMFDDTCRVDPGEDASGLPAECTSTLEPSGTNQWYKFPSYAVFELKAPKGAYITGNNSAVCEQGSNGATSCLIGRFIDAVAGGTVGQWDPTAPPQLGQQFAVQLIK